jgi:dTDP-4-amino-4,6-dideoxygalactose transaminase
MNIPLARPCLGPEEAAAVGSVLASGWLGPGALARRFEEALAARTGAARCVAVQSGTAALHLSLEAAEVRGFEVIVPSLTYAATVQAVLAAGGVPVFADCREDDLTIDAADAAARVTPRTRAIVPVHYGGTTADVASLRPAAAAAGAAIVEDAAHAFGSAFPDGTPVGAAGDFVCFSFDPIKTVTCGDGGAVCAGRPAWDARLRLLRGLGLAVDSRDRTLREEGAVDLVLGPGFRAHLNDLNAAIGLVQLGKADDRIAARRRIADRYDAALAGIPGLLRLARDPLRQAPFCYTIRVLNGRREAFRAALRSRGIETGVLYPPNHLQPAFREFRRPLPVTERIGREIVSLPLFSGLTDDDAGRVIEAAAGFFKAAPGA